MSLSCVPRNGQRSTRLWGQVSVVSGELPEGYRLPWAWFDEALPRQGAQGRAQRFLVDVLRELHDCGLDRLETQPRAKGSGNDRAGRGGGGLRDSLQTGAGVRGARAVRASRAAPSARGPRRHRLHHQNYELCPTPDLCGIGAGVGMGPPRGLSSGYMISSCPSSVHSVSGAW